MRCSSCGAELSDGVLFCRECGAKVEKSISYCSSCGSQLDPGVRFCKNCGAGVNSADSKGVKTENVKTVVIQRTNANYSDQNKNETKRMPSYNTSNTRKSSNNMLRIIIILAAVFVSVILIISALVNRKDSEEKSGGVIAPIASQTASDKIDYSISTEHTYAYMSDGWNVYIAVPISSSVIKIEHWDKTMSSTKKMSYSEDVGTYKIEDPENGFYWVDDEHTAFAFKLSDKSNSNVGNGKLVIFTINISDSDVCKGTDYDESIACYTYTNDDWHEYRAILLTDKLMKIEVWSRTSSMDKLLFGYDLFLLNPEDDSTDFEWGDNSHAAFTITTQDPENDYYWKGAKFVAFTLSNPDYSYSTVNEYINR